MTARTREELKTNINRDIVIGPDDSITVAEVNAILIDAADSMALEGHTHQVLWTDVGNKPAFAPSNAEQNVQSDWNAVSGDAFIRNKPSIGSAPAWGDITGKPNFAPANAERNVQANWNEARAGNDAFIVNKPDLAGLPPTTSGITTGFVPKVQSDGSVAWLPDLVGRNLEFTSEATAAVSGDGSASGTAGTRGVPITAGAVSLTGLTSDGSVYTLQEDGVWSFNFSTSVSTAATGNATHRWFHHLEFSTDGGGTWAPTTISPDLYTRTNPNLAAIRINGNHVFIGKVNTAIQFRWMSSSADQDILRAAYAAGDVFLIRLG